MAPSGNEGVAGREALQNLDLRTPNLARFDGLR
jgi:hypothetical protein